MRELGRQRQDVEGKSADEVAVEKVRGREKSVGDDRWRPHVNEGKPHQPEPLYKPL